MEWIISVRNRVKQNKKKEKKDRNKDSDVVTEVRVMATEDSPPGENITEKSQGNSEHGKVISWKDIVIGKKENPKEGEI